jgi:uncharacterized protein YdgA (DUF945 family)
MKKIVTLLSIPVALAVVWGGASWYIGQQTETLVKDQMAKSNELLAKSGVKQELVSYEKGLSSSKAISKIKFDNPMLAQTFGDLQIVNEIQNGPIFFGGGSGISTGLSRWKTTLDTQVLPAETQQKIKEVFEGRPPFEANTIVGFGNTASYVINVNPVIVKENGETVLSVAGVTAEGVSDTQDYTGTMHLQMGKLVAGKPGENLTIPTLEANADVKGLIATQILGTVDLKAPKISIQAQGLPEPATFDINVKTDTQQQNNDINSKFALNADNITIKGLPNSLTNASYTVDMQGLNVAGLEEVGKIQGELQNLQSQIEWNAEAMETPDGQKKQQEIITQMGQISEKLLNTIFAKVLQTDKTQIHQVLNLVNEKGKINADVNVTYTGKQAPKLNELASFTPNDWAKLMKAAVNIQADKAALPEAANMFTGMLTGQGLLKDEANQFKLDLKTNGDKVNLNGKEMTLDEFLAQVAPNLGASGAAAPDSSALGGEDMGLPADLMQKVKEQGLTPEVMQLIEESDDVPAETKETFKQLQAMQADLKAGKEPKLEEAPKTGKKAK